MRETSSHSNTFIITDFRLIIEVEYVPTQEFLITAQAVSKAAPQNLSFPDPTWATVTVSSLSAPVQATVVDNLHSELAPDPLAFLCLFRLCVVLESVSQLNGVGFLA